MRRAGRTRDAGPAPFTVSEYVDIDIDPADLEEAGWVWVGNDGGGAAGVNPAIEIVRDWHDLEHQGPWRFCQHALCDRLRGRDPDS